MTAELFNEEARYIIETVKRICTTAGPGIGCSPQEHARAGIIRKEMEKAVGAGNVTVEEFSCAPDAFLGWIRLGAATGAISVGLHFLARWTTGWQAITLSALSFLFAISIMAAFVFEFVLCREFLDSLFPKKGSVNVIGRIAPKSGRTEKILIFSGHHDSAYEFTWASRLKTGYYGAVAVIFWGVIAISIKTGLYALGLALGSGQLSSLGHIGWLNILVPVAPSIILAFFFLGSGKNGGTVPGAADNLSGSMVAVSIGRLLVNNPEFIPGTTEIRIISFGCEEAGMRGAKRYVKRHLSELREKDAGVCNFETIADPEVTILTSDCNGLVRNSGEVVDGLAAAARAAGVPHRVRPFPFGGAGTDACAFSEAGIKASCLLPVVYPRHLIRFYHQPADNWDILTPEPLINTLKIAIGWIGSGAR